MPALNIPIDNTDLVIVDTVYGASQVCLWREERGQNLIIVKVENTANGQTGHILYGCETDKRDFLDEIMGTDSHKLFEDQFLEAYEMQNLLNHIGQGCPSERTDEIDTIMAECLESHNQLKYSALDPDADNYDDKGWGVRPDNS